MSLLRAILSLTLVCAALPASGKSPESELWQKTDGSLMMALRSNAYHFWNWAAKNRSSFPPALLQFTGIVVGDPHHENFSHVFAQGRRVYVLNDMDDSGYAPLFLDFVKFAGVSLSAVEDENVLNTESMFQAYLDGVMQKAWTKKIPAMIAEDAKVSRQELADDYLKKIKNNTTDGDFDGSRDGMTVWKDLKREQKIHFQDLEERYFKAALPAGYEIKDRAIFAKEGGGSGGVERYWYYLKKSSDERHILEFKPIEEPAVADYQAQQPAAVERVRLASAVYWEQGVPAPFAVVGDRQQAFWLRPRYPLYIDLNVKQFIKHPQEFADLSNYIAFRMGRWHTSQNNASAYAAYLTQNQESVISASDRAIHSYLHLARQQQGR